MLRMTWAFRLCEYYAVGEMHFIRAGTTSAFNLPREKGVAYAAQESWVQNETIRVGHEMERGTFILTVLQENIIFGAHFDEVRYKKGELGRMALMNGLQ